RSPPSEAKKKPRPAPGFFARENCLRANMKSYTRNFFQRQVRAELRQRYRYDSKKTAHAALRIRMLQGTPLRSAAKSRRQAAAPLRDLRRRGQARGLPAHPAAQPRRARLRPRDQRRRAPRPPLLAQVFQKR